MYQTVPINLAGPSYQNRSLPLSAQQSVNFYQEVSEGAKSQNVMQPFFGLKDFGLQTGAERGCFQLNGQMYRVAGATLYKVSSQGVHTSLGAISGSGRCSFCSS